MNRILLGDREIYLGKHENLGYIIYDKSIEDEEDRVTLYLIDESRLVSYRNKSSLKTRLLKLNEDELEQLISIVEKDKSKIINILKRGFSPDRSPYCWDCGKKLDSYKFATCNSCKWVKCNCLSCGCNYPYTKENIANARLENQELNKAKSTQELNKAKITIATKGYFTNKK
jgi:hypothetical protein